MSFLWYVKQLWAGTGQNSPENVKVHKHKIETRFYFYLLPELTIKMLFKNEPMWHNKSLYRKIRQ